MLLFRLKKIFIGSILRRIVLIIILLITAAIVSYDFYSSGKVMYLENKNEILEYKLNSMIDGYEKNLDKYMRCWEVEDPVGIWECYIDSNLNRIKPIAGVRYVAVNNINGKLFWDYWPMKYYLQYGTKEASFNKNNIETYISKNSYKYIKYEYSGSEYIKKLPKNSSDKKIATANWTVYYWFDKRDNSVDKVLNDINSNIHNARKTMALMGVLYIAIAIYLISFLVYIKRFGIKKFLGDIQVENLKIKNKIGFIQKKIAFDVSNKKVLRSIKKIFLGGAFRQLILVIVISFIGIIVSCNFINSGDFNYLKLRTEKELENKDLMEGAFIVGKEIRKYTNDFKDIANNKIMPEDFEKHAFSGGGVRFAIVNNYNKKIYWDPWSIIDIKNYGTSISSLKSFENYIKNNSYVYVRFYEAAYPTIKYKNDSQVISCSIFYWEDYSDTMNNVGEWEIYYSKYETAWKRIAYIVVWIIILIIFIVSKGIYIKKFGIKKFLKDMKAEITELKNNCDFICEKLSFEGPYKKSCIILIYTLIFYLLVEYSLYPEEEVSSHFLFIIFIFILFLFSLKKARYFKDILEYTYKLTSGNLSLDIKKSKDCDMDKLANSINSIKLGYEEAFKNQIKTEIAKTELIANVSHDLKTPLTSILSYADLIKRKNLSLEEKQDYMKIVEMKTEKLSILINDLIEVSEVNNGIIQLHKEEIDIIALIYQVIGECSNYHGEKKIKFKVKSFKDRVMLCVDGKRMSRLIGNVISNSIKYSMPNTNVYIEIKEESDQIIIAFKSISENEMQFDVKEIFERFKRGDESRNSKVEGSGLGLAIARGIAELHGGRMYAEKEGDMFKMYLILKQDLEAD